MNRIPDRIPSVTDRPIAVTMGDPAGVGLQMTIRAWQHRTQYDLPPFAVFSTPSALQAHIDRLNVDVSVVQIDHPNQAADVFKSALPLIAIGPDSPVDVGKTDPHHSQATQHAIEQAVATTMAGQTAAVVTNPITKSTLTASGFAYPGHTEFLGALAAKFQPSQPPPSPVMMLASKELCVVPLTIHIPLRRAADSISRALIVQTLKTMDKALRSDFGIAQPRIAVAGLNPHAGENATLGEEDRDVIAPAIALGQSQGLNVSGPRSADTMFHEAARQTYDAALCMYHDQALIPIKTLAFDRGVNVTLGLPFVRTSPDHGTALAIAGTSKVSITSFVESVRRAHQFAAARERFNGSKAAAATSMTPGA